MTQEVAIDIDKAVVLIMDFQQRVVNNRASDPQAVVQNASQALQAAREGEDACATLVARQPPSIPPARFAPSCPARTATAPRPSPAPPLRPCLRAPSPA